MSEHGLAAAVAKMRAAGANEPAIDVFAHYYAEAAAGVTGMIPESTISPLTDPPQLSDAAVDPDAARAAIARTVIIKLNGGLGTSMGLDQAKTLLPVRDGLTFLDLIVGQITAAREAYDAPLPLLFMNSFRTRADTLAHLERYPDLAVDGLPIDFVQNAEPKITADTFEPVEWPADPTLEWCPPGHGDVYTALVGSGVLDALLAAGMKYASISNGDNLGAAPDAELAHDNTATGAEKAAGARAALPTAAAKAEAWRLAVDEPSVPNETHTQLCLQFWQLDQNAALEPYVDKWFDVMQQIAAQQNGWGQRSLAIRRNVGELLFPRPLGDRALAARITDWLATTELTDSVRRMVSERLDDLARALRCQEAVE